MKTDSYVVALIGGRTSDKKEFIKKAGFRWHSKRRNWFKYGPVEELNKLHRQCRKLWNKYPGEILFKTFVVEPKIDNGIPF